MKFSHFWGILRGFSLVGGSINSSTKHVALAITDPAKTSRLAYKFQYIEEEYYKKITAKKKYIYIYMGPHILSGLQTVTPLLPLQKLYNMSPKTSGLKTTHYSPFETGRSLGNCRFLESGAGGYPASAAKVWDRYLLILLCLYIHEYTHNCIYGGYIICISYLHM